MMLLLLLVKKRLLSSLLVVPSRSANKTTLSTPSHNHLLARCLSTAATQNPSPKPHFMVDYLVKSCGFSSDKAARASKQLAHLKSPQKPDAVIHFLKHHGFDETHIRTIISGSPGVLCCGVETALEPNIKALLDTGFSLTELKQLALSSPNVLVLNSTMPRIKFWRTHLGNDKKKLLVVFKRNRGLINHDIVTSITPKIALLKNYGLTDQQIEKLLLQADGFITRSTESMEALLNQTLELGFPCSSSLFIHGLYALSSNGKEGFNAKMELLKGCGWSDCEFINAFQKSPRIIHLSMMNICRKMKFLVERAGCTPSYIACHPTLLGLSLEKRLMPRHHILQLLKVNKVVMKALDLHYIMSHTDKRFVEKFILRYKEKVPELHEAYIAACAGRITF